jgi:hypothetical protein
LDYRRELTVPEMAVTSVELPPGEHTDFRIYWQTILDLIPEKDLTRITQSGGELDLIWHVNGLHSPPLPLLLGWEDKDD